MLLNASNRLIPNVYPLKYSVCFYRCLFDTDKNVLNISRRKDLVATCFTSSKNWNITCLVLKNFGTFGTLHFFEALFLTPKIEQKFNARKQFYFMTFFHIKKCKDLLMLKESKKKINQNANNLYLFQQKIQDLVMLKKHFFAIIDVTQCKITL